MKWNRLFVAAAALMIVLSDGICVAGEIARRLAKPPRPDSQVVADAAHWIAKASDKPTTKLIAFSSEAPGRMPMPPSIPSMPLAVPSTPSPSDVAPREPDLHNADPPSADPPSADPPSADPPGTIPRPPFEEEPETAPLPAELPREPAEQPPFPWVGPDRLPSSPPRARDDGLAGSGLVPPGLGLELSQAEQIALANNPTLVQAMMRIEAARAKCVQAGLYPNPRIGYVADEIGIQGSAGQHGAFVAQEIVTGGKRQARQAVYEQEIHQAEQVWVAQRGRVLTDVRIAWHQAAVAGERVAMSKEIEAVCAKAATMAAKLKDDASVEETDVWQSKVEVDSARLRLFHAETRQEAAWQRLAAVLGTPDMQPAPLALSSQEPLGELDREETLRNVLAESPELAEAHAALRRAQREVSRQCAERIPNIDLRAGVRYHDETDDAVAAVQIGLPLPIFDRNQGNISRARSNLIVAHKEIERVELALRQRFARAFAEYSAARRQVEQYEAEILPNAQRSLDEVLDGYAKLKYDYLTLLTTQRTYFQVHSNYLDSILAYQSSRALLEGLLLSGGLGSVDEVG